MANMLDDSVLGSNIMDYSLNSLSNITSHKIKSILYHYPKFGTPSGLLPSLLFSNLLYTNYHSEHPT